MQTFTQALIDLVLTDEVDREAAANAATNRHDFLVALDRAVKQRADEERTAAERVRPRRTAGLRLVQPGNQ